MKADEHRQAANQKIGAGDLGPQPVARQTTENRRSQTGNDNDGTENAVDDFLRIEVGRPGSSFAVAVGHVIGHPVGYASQGKGHPRHSEGIENVGAILQ